MGRLVAAALLAFVVFAPAHAADAGVEADLAALRDADAATRLAALSRLRTSEDPAALPGLIEAWSDADAGWGRQLERAALDVAERRPVARVLDVLAGTSAKAEGIAALLLSELLDRRTEAELRKRLGTAQAGRLAPILAATGRFEAPEMLLAVLETPGRPGRTAVIGALGRLPGFAGRIVPALKALRPDAPEDEARAILAAALALPGPKTAAWLADEALGDGLALFVDDFRPADRPDVLRALAARLPVSQEALRALTGKQFGIDPETWRQWIDRVEAGSADEVSSPVGRPAPPETESFYGVRLPEGDFVFLIDASGSMRGHPDSDDPRPIDLVKERMLEILEDLPEERRFDVVFFNDRAFRFRGSLVSASEENVRLARKFIEDIRARGKTNLEAGLEAALRDPAVVDVVLLSDGAPTGRVRSVEAVMRLLDGRDVRIHTIAKSANARFMKALAEATGGRRGTF